MANTITDFMKMTYESNVIILFRSVFQSSYPSANKLANTISAVIKGTGNPDDRAEDNPKK